MEHSNNILKYANNEGFGIILQGVKIEATIVRFVPKSAEDHSMDKNPY